MSDYGDFLTTKALRAPASGHDVLPGAIHERLFPFQRDLVRWAVRKGRAALFADTGLGKTGMQLEWARLTGERALILAPLAVAQQTVREAALLGIDVGYARHQGEAADGITITNYERLDRFDPSAFGAVVLDESSILKSFDGKTRTALIASFANTPWRLACTATPAPNDIAELANHAEFLSVMTRVLCRRDDAGALRMTTPRIQQATRRGPQWAPEPTPSRWRPWLQALLLFGVIVACGIDSVRW